MYLQCILSSWASFFCTLKENHESCHMILTVDSVTTLMKAIEQYFAVVFFIMLYKVVLTFKCVDEILQCDHSNESY